MDFNIIDTGGIDIGDEPFLEQIKQQAEIAIDEADVIIFLVNGRDGILQLMKKWRKFYTNPKSPLS